MKLEENVSVVALIISLIALMIALLQLSAALFGTAEGYRRCGEATIGPWSQLRWRKPIKSELRFETHFEAPHLVLRGLEDIYWFDKPTVDSFSGENITYALNAAQSHDRRSGLPKKASNIVQWYLRIAKNFRRPGREARRQVLHAITTSATRELVVASAHGVTLTISERSPPPEVHKDDAEKDIGLESEASQPVAVPREMAPQNELAVSWLSLLQILSLLNDPAWSIDALSSHAFEGHKRTAVGIRFTPYVWDLLPPDTQKPLASSDIGTIIVLAVRMGMQWRTLNPDEGRMSADGNGYVLSSVDARGLGIVLKLRSIGKHERIPAFTQSAAVDKTICGVLPGCPRLVNQEFNIVTEDRKLDLKDTVIRRIDVRNNTSWESNNELPVLLCDFLPLRGDRAIVHSAFSRIGIPPGRSTFSWWEGRYALRNCLASKPDKSPQLEKILQWFLKFEENYRAFFYNGHHEPSRAIQVLEGTTADKLETQSRLLHDCRDAFNWTTLKFEELNYHEMSPDGINTFYVCLVAAHYRLAHETVDLHRDLEKKQKDAWKRRLPQTWPRNLRIGSEDVYQMVVERTVHLTTKEEWSITEAMAKRGKVIDAKEAELVWWLLMLRGVAWILSTEPVASSFPVPASMYGNPTPVWIT